MSEIYVDGVRYVRAEEQEAKDSIVEVIHLHRYKEDNYGVVQMAERYGFKDPDVLHYLGYEIELEVEIDKDCVCKLLKFDGVDVSDKNIFL